MKRTKCTVKSVKASPFITTAWRPFTFIGAARKFYGNLVVKEIKHGKYIR